ncbi:TPA: tail fiber assembly protein [Providencia alcalifaciens]
MKNISAGDPKTNKTYEVTHKEEVIWLFSEDGRDWYEEQKNFQAETLKVAYAENGQVVCVTEDISAINPNGLSVIEIDNNTENQQIDISGYWFFNDGRFVFDYVQKANDVRNRLVLDADAIIQSKGVDLFLGGVSEEELSRLRAWRCYVEALRALVFTSVTDRLSYEAIVWPTKPE